MATYERLDYGSPDGSQWGTSTDAIGFYGKTPVTRYVGVGAASTYSVTSNTTSTVGFTTLADLTSFILQVSTLTVAFKRAGIVA